ncbi:MAG: DUF2314 domain-containing protein [Undibacterium umbellatum]|uniref:DUF2314 domain-containing protein n=1 Tax=Undibacterium umbellatum TaxID=2762300 RepID=UPI003BB53A92
MSDEKLLPVFIPALIALLVNAEDKKSTPLTPDEVLEIRDNASVMMMEKAHADALAESRGYDDIDPENCWYEWQMCRREMGRKPDLDPGAKITMTNSNDVSMQQAFADAQQSLPHFRKLIHSNTDKEFFPLIKTKFALANGNMFVWLRVVESSDTGFTGELFEVPAELRDYEVGDTFNVEDAAIIDWMINHGGAMHGGHTIRAHRATLNSEEQAKLDTHLGVSRYL